jgi:hypothetical protein
MADMCVSLLMPPVSNQHLKPAITLFTGAYVKQILSFAWRAHRKEARVGGPAQPQKTPPTDPGWPPYAAAIKIKKLGGGPCDKIAPIPFVVR